MDRMYSSLRLVTARRNAPYEAAELLSSACYLHAAAVEKLPAHPRQKDTPTVDSCRLSDKTCLSFDDVAVPVRSGSEVPVLDGRLIKRWKILAHGGRIMDH